MAFIPQKDISLKNPFGGFGDGSLGNVTISSNTNWIRSGTKSCNNLTINAGITLIAHQTIILVKNLLTINGNISASGYGSPGGAGGTGRTSNSLNDPIPVVHNGSPGTNGTGLGASGASTPQTSVQPSGHKFPILGGLGASGGKGNALEWAGIVTDCLIDELYEYLITKGGGGAGGGGGGYGNIQLVGGTNRVGGTGGAGGAGGGVLIIAAKNINVSATGAIRAEGVNGTSGISGPVEGSPLGGDGGRGGGGAILLVYSTLTGAGVISVAGGNNGLLNKVVV